MRQALQEPRKGGNQGRLPGGDGGTSLAGWQGLCRWRRESSLKAGKLPMQRCHGCLGSHAASWGWKGQVGLSWGSFMSWVRPKVLVLLAVRPWTGEVRGREGGREEGLL